jgi:YfiH family protein
VGAGSATRDRVRSWLGAAGLAAMDAVHGADVAVVSGPGVVAGVDGLVTQQPGLAVLALGADCVPIALSGSDGRTVAAAHCGWRGLVEDVVGTVVRRMADLGTTVHAVVLGGSVCGPCYPVPAERADEVRDRCSSAVSRRALVRRADGQPGIDVREGVRARLVELGIPGSAVTVAAGCTVEDAGLFSYRRDGVTGRQGIAIARMSP